MTNSEESTIIEIEQLRVISQDNEGLPNLQHPFTQIIQSIEFRPACRKQVPYDYIKPSEEFRPMSYKIHNGNDMEVITKIDGENETRKIATCGDYIICGPAGEQYVIGSNRFATLYDLDSVNGEIRPKRATRMVGQYEGTETIVFHPPWHSEASFSTMILKHNDWLVREDYIPENNYPTHLYNYRGDNFGFCRIEKSVFEDTYIFITDPLILEI